MCTPNPNLNDHGIGTFFKNYTDAIVSNIRLAVLDTNCTITWVNERFCEVTCYEPNELIGKPLGETKLVCLKAEEFKTIHAHISAGHAWSGEIKTRTKKGSKIWLKTNILPILKKEGGIGSFLIVSSDITPMKNALEEKKAVMEVLTKSEARYRALIENQPDLMSLCDRNGTRIFVNEKYCEFMGKSENELLGTNIKDLPLGGVSLHIVDQVLQMTPENKEISGVLELTNASGEKVWMSLSVRGIFNKEGELFELMTTGRDVTVLKNAELGLSKHVEDLERIAFLTSHKVRSPITTMMGILDLLRLNAIHSEQWNKLLGCFDKCMVDLDQYTRELGAFINQSQAIRKGEI